MFRNLSNKLINSSRIWTKYYCTSKSMVISIKETPSDPLLATIKSATNPFELFEVTSCKRKELSADHLLHAFKALFSMQRNEETSIPSPKILKNPDFDLLCRNLKNISRSLSLNDAIEILKILFYIGVPANSPIGLTLLHLIRNQINDITIGHIIFLDFLLKKTESIPLVEALRMALPMLLQIQIGTKMDHENVAQLTELLIFVTRNSVSEQCVMNIVTALTLHGEDLSLDQARSILWSLTDVKSFNPNYEKLLQNCINVLNKSFDLFTFEGMDTTLSRMIDKYQQRYTSFYHERFCEECVNYVIQNDVGFLNAIFVQKKLSKINFISAKLLDYLIAKIRKDSNELSSTKPMALFTLVNALSIANYDPENFKDIKKIIIENVRYHQSKNDLPWIKFTLELISLNIFVSGLVNKIYQKEFLDRILSREYNALDYLQLLTLYQCTQLLWPDYDGNQLDHGYVNQAVKMIDTIHGKADNSFKPFVELAFGKECVYHSVQNQWGHVIDHLVLFDKDGNPIPGKSNALKDGLFIDLQNDVNHKMIAIAPLSKMHFGLNIPKLKGTSELRIKTLVKTGIPVVVINLQHWLQLPEHERIPYIQREVRYELSMQQ